MDTENKEQQLRHLLAWIMANSDWTEAMEEINRATFRFTTKFKSWKEYNKD